MKLEVLSISCVSATLEIKYDEENVFYPHYSKKEYDLYLNDSFIRRDNKNVFTLHDLKPDSSYTVKLVMDDEVTLEFKTLEVSEIVEVFNEGDIDYTNIIQGKINNLKDNGLLVIHEGVYLVNALFLKSNITINLKKGAHLLGETDRMKYPILNEYFEDGKPLGNWEGNVSKQFASLITGIRVSNVVITGEGIIDGNAQNSDWWIDPKKIRVATRPNLYYLNYCENVSLIGVTCCNSGCWTLHPFYSKNVRFLDLFIKNPNTSPNTDGCDPEACDGVDIIGCKFSVGDDCIAIKSGKKELADSFYQPCNNITIRNCLMQDGHGAVVLGSEMSSGITNLDVTDCLFLRTDRGLRIKTRRGRGDKAIVDGVLFKNIKMDEVLNPFVINMFYFCDPDGKSDYVQNKEPLPVDSRTPYLGEFKFLNIDCKNSLVSAAFFYGLPEQKIKKVTFENVNIHMKESDEYGSPAMMLGIDKYNRLGCYFNNVSEVVLKNLNIENVKGEAFEIYNVDNIKQEK